MPPAKIACKGCRLSKIKCDLEHRTDGVCSRCVRLGLLCLPTGPSQRGRPNARRDVSRLGPKVKQLLLQQPDAPAAEPEAPAKRPRHDDDDADAAPCPVRLCSSPNTSSDALTAFHAPPKACTHLVAQLTTQPARLAWVRHGLYMAQAAKHLGMLQCFLGLAHKFGLPYEDTHPALCAVDPAREPEPQALPGFIRACYDGAGAVALTRLQAAGRVSYLPSPALAELFGLQPGAELTHGLATLLEAEADRAAIYELTGRLWAQIVDADAEQHVCVDDSRALRFTYNGATYGPFRLRGRLVLRERSLRTWTCISLLRAEEVPRALTAQPALHVASGAVLPPPSALGPHAPRVAIALPAARHVSTMLSVGTPLAPLAPLEPAARSSWGSGLLGGRSGSGGSTTSPDSSSTFLEEQSGSPRSGHASPPLPPPPPSAAPAPARARAELEELTRLLGLAQPKEGAQPAHSAEGGSLELGHELGLPLDELLELCAPELYSAHPGAAEPQPDSARAGDGRLPAPLAPAPLPVAVPVAVMHS